MEWLQRLPERLRNSLNSLLDTVEQNEDVYMSASNASVAQIWVAMAYLNRRTERLEQLVNAQRKALNQLDQEVEIENHLDENLEESLKRY